MNARSKVGKSSAQREASAANTGRESGTDPFPGIPTTYRWSMGAEGRYEKHW